MGALEAIWQLLCRDDLEQESGLTQASALRRVLLDSVVDSIEASVPELVFGDLRTFPGEALITHFIAQSSRLFDELLRPSS